VSSFDIGKYEVTQAQWVAVMGTTVAQQRDKADPSWSLDGEGSNYPMYYVSWDDAQEFISKLKSMTGKNFRLPTEAEWEYAARGGSQSRGYKYAGSNSISNVAWYNDNSGGGKTHPVGKKQPNELGLYDMSGNVHEWCSDWYGDYSSSAKTNPVGPSSGPIRVDRGGSWTFGAQFSTVSSRKSTDPDYRTGDHGFRLVSPR
jgi:formylglycine-generating enzyme required for sulfatase activity